MRPISLLCLLLSLACAAQASPVHAIAMNAEPRYGTDFEHFDYVNPDAPRQGHLRLHARGTFDSFQPFVIKGLPAEGLSLVYERLMEPSQDEPFTQYGLIARALETDPERTQVIFHLDPRAQFSDGHPVTAEDVAFSFRFLTTQGSPHYAQYYAGVDSLEILDRHRIRFDFAPGENRELPLILGQLPILPAHIFAERDFSRANLDTPIGSGPYRLADYDPGRSVTYERNPDYWGEQLPVNRGRYNFERVSYEYYRDETVALEAFKAGQYDFRQEYSASNWAQGYASPALDDGRIQRELISHQLPQGMQGFVYNTRRAPFDNPLVREALAYAFDFEWSNRSLFHGQYQRTRSYFDNSKLAATGLPDSAELRLLEPLREQLPERVFTQAYQPPSTQGANGLRQNLRRALELLRSAGWTIADDGRLRNPNGQAMSFELLLAQPSFERVALPLKRNLERLGIDMRVRTLDVSQYVSRLQRFDFDICVSTFGQSDSPGNEQRNYWSSQAANQPGSRNLAGISSPAIDELVEKLIGARSRAELRTRTRALDRALQWGHYVIPHWHLAGWRLAWWNHLEHPEPMPSRGLDIWSWWISDPRQ